MLSLRHPLAVCCGEVEHLHFVSDSNGFEQRGRVTDLMLSTVLPLHSRLRIEVVRNQLTEIAKSTKAPRSPKSLKSVLLQSASALGEESSFNLQVTRLCRGWGRRRGGGERDGIVVYEAVNLTERLFYANFAI